MSSSIPKTWQPRLASSWKISSAVAPPRQAHHKAHALSENHGKQDSRIIWTMDLAILIFSLSIISTNASVTAFEFQSVLERDYIKFENELCVVWDTYSETEHDNFI